MVVSYQKLTNKTESNSFVDFWVKENSFGVHWHYHPEVEICYIKEGEGHRIVGDSVESFKAGDLVLVGSNLPHCWTSSEVFNSSIKNMEVYVIQFRSSNLFNDSIEFNRINNLLIDARRGIKFDVVKCPNLIADLTKIYKSNGLDKYLNLIKLLQKMAATSYKGFLVSKLYAPDYSKKAEVRIEKVCGYIHQNYRDRISLDELSNLASMNTASFCRFFKKCMGKTIIEYINGLRIDYACFQLQRTSTSIYKIAFDSGYQSLTQFNKVFKKLLKTTPTAYRKSKQVKMVNFS